MTSTEALADAVQATVEPYADRLSVKDGDVEMAFHYVWLRDNCWCDECRVAQSGERRLFTADIPEDIQAVEVHTTEHGLVVRWSDGHGSTYSLAWLRAHDYSNRRSVDQGITYWTAELGEPPRFDHDRVLNEPDEQAAYLATLARYGAVIVANTPARDGEVERFAEALGHVRETAFERIHNVRFDPHGYNVAHTPLELKPHSDLPSYHWPPSVQLLHFLVNDASGGESTLVDGWAVLRDLRADDPAAFDALARVPISFQLFSDDEDTQATAPLVQLDPEGRVRTFRYSNQLALPVQAAFDTVPEWYAAYRKLGRMIDSPTYKLAFKAHNGDLLMVHSHRVLHGRLPFDPTSGARHLQDVYMEYDDLMARRRVLTGTHKPQPSNQGAQA